MNFSTIALAVLGKKASAPGHLRACQIVSSLYSRLTPKERQPDVACRIQAEAKMTEQNHYVSLKTSPPSDASLMHLERCISPTSHFNNLYSVLATRLYFISDTFGYLYTFQDKKKSFLLLQWFHGYPHVKRKKGSHLKLFSVFPPATT